MSFEAPDERRGCFVLGGSRSAAAPRRLRPRPARSSDPSFRHLILLRTLSSFPHLVDPLTDGGVVLRDYAERDIPEILIAYQDDPRLHVLTGEDRPPTGAELGSRSEREAAARAAGEHATLTILEPDSDTCRGQIRVEPVDVDHARAELRIWLAPQVRGRGLGRRALRLAGEWLLGPCQMARVELLAEAENAAALRCAQSAGFVREGVLREYRRRRAQGVDVIVMSLIPADL